jgi:hypothetical protein
VTQTDILRQNFDMGGFAQKRVSFAFGGHPQRSRVRHARLTIAPEAEMDESSGRGHREKKPSEKLKELVTAKIDKIEDEKPVVLPTYVAPNDPKFLQDQKEIPKFLDHTKIAPNGDKTEFFTLGTQCENPPSRAWRGANS